MSDDHRTGNPDAGSGGEETPPDFFEVRVTGGEDDLNRAVSDFGLDIGCRHPHVEPHDDGTFTLFAFATSARIVELQAAGYAAERGENVSARGRALLHEIGRGDRFEGGRKAPSGLGIKHGRDSKAGRS